MWHLQLPKFNQKHNYFLTLLLGSTLFHLSVCGLLFFVYSDSQKLQFEVSSVPRDIIVQLATVSTPQKSTLKTKVKVSASKTTTPIKVSQKTGLATKPIKQQKLKVVAQKIKEPVKKTPEQKEIKKVEQIIKPEPKKESDTEPAKPVTQDTPQVIEVTQQELNQLELEQLVQETIAATWAPPAGMDKDLVCKVTLTIDWNGTITETVLSEPSKVLIYNIAVEQTISRLQLPRPLWGKSITLVFKP